jgi:tryptophanyl-tRNA synthetase
VAAPGARELPRGKRILSGIKPTGIQHLGNYFGAVRQHIALQEHNQGTYFIADYHSMTSLLDAEERRRLTREIALDYLALGLDPKRSILYRQSDLPEVCELTWILDTLAPMGLLERGHAYKDARAKGEAVSVGLFNYPVLMAADILIHRADLVPVGQDQKQHVEVTRDLAVKFNQTYGEVLALPEPWILEEVAVVPGTDGRKMSKSYDNAIEMFAPEKELRRQVMGIVTDSAPVESAKDPDRSHLFALWSLFATPDERAAMADRFRKGPLGYGEVKKDLLARVLAHFADARAQRAELARRADTVEDVLHHGAGRARETAAELLATCRRTAGLGPPTAGDGL